MSKRFVDTDIWKHAWFCDLTVKQKCLWRLICEECDSTGVWPVNLKLAGYYIGEEIETEDLEALGMGKRLVRISDDKVWIPGFIRFQYKTLNPANKAHRGIMRSILSSVGSLPLEGESKELIDLFREYLKEGVSRGSTDPQPTVTSPPTMGQVTLQDKEKDKVKEKDKEKEEGGVGEETKPIPGIAPREEIAQCEQDWKETLEHFKVPPPKECSYQEKVSISEAIKKHGFDRVRWALIGRRFEPPTDTFKPENHLSIHRTFKPDLFGKFENLAKKKFANQKQREAS